MIVPLRVLMVAVVLAPVLQAAPPGFVMWSSSELEQRDAALSTRVGQDHSARETLVDYGYPPGAYRFRFIYRDAAGERKQEKIRIPRVLQAACETLAATHALGACCPPCSMPSPA